MSADFATHHPRWRHISRYTSRLIYPILWLAFVARVLWLGDREFRSDESFTCSFTVQTLANIVSETFRLHEPHPIGSYVIQRFWYGLTGFNELTMRFPSACFGVVGVALLYRFSEIMRRAAKSIPPMVSVLAMLLMTVSPYAIMHARIMRMYAMHMTLTLASMTLFALILTGRRKRRVYVALTGVGLAALHVHYYAVFILAAQSVLIGLFWLTTPAYRNRTFMGRWVASQLAIALLYLPWIIPASRLVADYPGLFTSPTLREMLVDWLGPYTIGEYLYMVFTFDYGFRTQFAIFGGGLVLLGWVKLVLTRPSGPVRWLCVVYFLVSPIAIAIIAQSRPVFAPRYLIASVPAFFWLIALALWPIKQLSQPTPMSTYARPKLDPRWLGQILLSIVLGITFAYGIGHELTVFYTNELESRTADWKTLVNMVKDFSGAHPAAQEKLVMNYPDPTLPCYYGTGNLALLTMPPQQNDARGSETMAQQLVDSRVRRILFQEVGSDAWDRDQVARQAIEARYTKIEEVFTGRWILRVYSRPLLADLTPIGATFADVATLQSTQLLPTFKGHLLEVNLRWQRARNALQGREKVFMHLVRANSDNAPVAQLDVPLLADDLGGDIKTYGIRLPAGLGEGEYRLRLGVYDPGQNGAPRLRTQSGADAVELDVTL